MRSEHEEVEGFTLDVDQWLADVMNANRECEEEGAE
jgi:hypothetical protein